MKKSLSLLAAFAGVCAALPALAAQPTYSSQAYGTNATPAAAPASYSFSTKTPDYIAASFGWYDFDKDGDRDSVDYRLDYQWGASLIPMLDHDWASLDKWVQLHPVVGFEGNGDGMTFFNGGANLDVFLGSKFIFTWGETLGWYGHGDSKQTLGSPFEMRSQLELGYRFDNDMRLSGYISHLSNAGVGDRDPGAEIVGAYLRVPVSWLAHK